MIRVKYFGSTCKSLRPSPETKTKGRNRLFAVVIVHEVTHALRFHLRFLETVEETGMSFGEFSIEICSNGPADRAKH